jgi:hypothetical protein
MKNRNTPEFVMSVISSLLFLIAAVLYFTNNRGIADKVITLAFVLAVIDAVMIYRARR